MRQDSGRSRSSLGSDRPTDFGRRPSTANGFLGWSVLRRWTEKGYIPAFGSGTIQQQRFSGFPPLLEQELPSIKVEVVD
jgi:hypothetical protein